MEMHVVMTKGNLTMDEAKADPKGIAVIGYFIDVSKPNKLFLDLKKINVIAGVAGVFRAT